MTPLKSLAHKNWPYTGTPHEWRGFAEKQPKPDHTYVWSDYSQSWEVGAYQKQNFGPELD